MSIVPIFFRNIGRPVWSSRLLDNHLAGRVMVNDIFDIMASVVDSIHDQHRVAEDKRPLHRPYIIQQDSGSTLNATRNKFQINLDVQQFTPEEISVKYIDKCIVVEGKHKEKEDEHGFITRSFVRRYMLPNDHNEKDIVSSLSSDGILTITCPNKELEEKTERAIPITHTGQPMKKVVDNPVKENGEAKKEGEKIES
ncbi:protein lethal(2)essential for life-like [Anopheles nili]|uniref:protein lethal(2)essential for life-like n=1 Tax=Anopheles nili TaxID=185578 RepID=UPI00237BAA95|nr:protein lethal(2)essential for life-like [Anopheles nili]